MAMKTANDEVYFRIKSAGALKAAGIRLNKPEMEQEGRENYAAAYLENAILVYTNDLTDEAREALAKLLFVVQPEDALDTEADEDEIEMAMEGEAAQLRSANTPFDLVRPSELPPETLYDPDNEVEEEEDDYEDWDDLPDETEGDEV